MTGSSTSRPELKLLSWMVLVKAVISAERIRSCEKLGRVTMMLRSKSSNPALTAVMETCSFSGTTKLARPCASVISVKAGWPATLTLKATSLKATPSSSMRLSVNVLCGTKMPGKVKPKTSRMAIRPTMATGKLGMFLDSKASTTL